MYRELDFTKSFKQLKELFVAYNNVLKVRMPEQYQKLSLKSTHLETMKEILRFYGGYLYNNKKHQLPQDRRFWITNTGIAKNKLQHRSTIFRHIVVLQKAEVITNKVFHGSNWGLEIEINPYILVYKQTLADAKAWIKNELLTLDQKSASFSTPVASCNDKDPSHFLDTNNINKTCVQVNKSLVSEKQLETFCQKQGSKVRGDLENTNDSSSVKEQETLTLARAGEDPLLKPAIAAYTDKAWLFAKSILYPNIDFEDHQVKLSKYYIRDYFALISQKGFHKNVDRLFTDLCERILLAKKYIDRSPARYIPVPWTWFDKNFTGGFTGTLAWLKKVKQKRSDLKKQHRDLETLCSIYKAYASDISVHTYKKTEAKI